MKICTKKLTYFVCSLCLIHTKETEKNKNKHFNSNADEEKFIRKEI